MTWEMSFPLRHVWNASKWKWISMRQCCQSVLDHWRLVKLWPYENLPVCGRSLTTRGPIHMPLWLCARLRVCWPVNRGPTSTTHAHARVTCVRGGERIDPRPGRHVQTDPRDAQARFTNTHVLLALLVARWDLQRGGFTHWLIGELTSSLPLTPSPPPLPANPQAMTDSYPSINRSAVSVTPAGANVTGRERDAVLAVAEVAVLAVIFAMALLGNGLVLVVLLRQRRHHSPLHQFMLNLCVADLVVALFQVTHANMHTHAYTLRHVSLNPHPPTPAPTLLEVLPQLVWDAQGRLPGPDFLCRLVKYLQVLGMFASSYMIVAMTVDRHYAICCPLQAHRSGASQRWNSFIVLAWGLSLLLSLPQVGRGGFSSCGGSSCTQRSGCCQLELIGHNHKHIFQGFNVGRQNL